MDTTDHNAAIYYSSDAYDPDRHGLNGRRVAGRSFLQGYLRHMGEGQVTACVEHERDEQEFRSFVETTSPGRATRVIPGFSRLMEEVGTLFYPAAALADRAWTRMLRGQARWSLCGITHTTATRAAMGNIADLLAAPVEPWDALICTSQAVRASVQVQFDLVEDYHRRRFGAQMPLTRPMTPVIPLGIDSAGFVDSPARRQSLRQDLGIKDDDILCMVLSRLVMWGKFDPLPLYLAMQCAAKLTGRKLHLALVGRLDGGAEEAHFSDAACLMPDVTLHLLDGLDPDTRQGAFSGSDIFLFPIDNLQETFGIAPVEAMAAGLPVIATDWDGLRDTISPECGILVPTVTGNANHSRLESLRYLVGTDNEAQFQGLMASMTAFNIDAMGHVIARLADDPGQRKRMGQAGRLRAARHYDWSVIIPQMQDLWRAQNERRSLASDAEQTRYAQLEVPVLPSAFANFAAWPSSQVETGTMRIAANMAPDLPDIALIWALRRQDLLRRHAESQDRLIAVLDGLRDAGGVIDSLTLARKLAVPLASVERAALWLIKYDLARLA